jgi:hypothetical protein
MHPSVEAELAEEDDSVYRRPRHRTRGGEQAHGDSQGEY